MSTCSSPCHLKLLLFLFLFLFLLNSSYFYSTSMMLTVQLRFIMSSLVQYTLSYRDELRVYYLCTIIYYHSHPYPVLMAYRVSCKDTSSPALASCSHPHQPPLLVYTKMPPLFVYLVLLPFPETIIMLYYYEPKLDLFHLTTLDPLCSM